MYEMSSDVTQTKKGSKSPLFSLKLTTLLFEASSSWDRFNLGRYIIVLDRSFVEFLKGESGITVEDLAQCTNV